jgi:uncharacterized membrane protein YhaH (DUF805 family)
LGIALAYVDQYFIDTTYPDGFPYSGISGIGKNLVSEFIAFPISTSVYYLTWIPLLAVAVRRMHDVGRSGWWMIIPFVMVELFSLIETQSIFLLLSFRNDFSNLSVTSFIIMGLIAVLALLAIASFIFSVTDSDRDPNAYGISPKYGNDVFE